MSFLKKLFGKRNAAPEWAGFMEAAEFARFIATVRAELSTRGTAFEVSDSERSIRIPGSTGPQVLGLLNLAQRCHQIPPENWSETVRRHFDTLLTGTPQAAEFLETLEADFQRAKEYLKVRIHPTGYAAGLGATVSEPLAEDLISVLVYDLPDQVASVHPNHVAKWGVPQHDLFQLGLRNVRDTGLLTPQRIDLGEGAYLDHYEDLEDYFGASHALLLHEYFNPLPELGILLSVPHRHGMVVHPIRNRSARVSLNALLYYTPRLYEQGPGSITPSIYWYHAGCLTQIPYETGANDTIKLHAPEIFYEQVLAKIETLP